MLLYTFSLPKKQSTTTTNDYKLCTNRNLFIAGCHWRKNKDGRGEGCYNKGAKGSPGYQGAMQKDKISCWIYLSLAAVDCRM